MEQIENLYIPTINPTTEELFISLDNEEVYSNISLQKMQSKRIYSPWFQALILILFDFPIVLMLIFGMLFIIVSFGVHLVAGTMSIFIFCVSPIMFIVLLLGLLIMGSPIFSFYEDVRATYFSDNEKLLKHIIKNGKVVIGRVAEIRINGNKKLIKYRLIDPNNKNEFWEYYTTDTKNIRVFNKIAYLEWSFIQIIL